MLEDIRAALAAVFQIGGLIAVVIPFYFWPLTDAGWKTGLIATGAAMLIIGLAWGRE